MDKYKNFSVDDFLQDEFFRRWVNKPAPQEAAMWERWLDENPGMWQTVSDAKSIVAAFEYQPQRLPHEFFAQLKSRIDTTINDETPQRKVGFSRSQWMQLAAAVLGIIVAAGVIFKLYVKEDGLLTYTSKYGETKRVQLPDGSEVILNANSTLKYKLEKDKQRREVWLTGEGFFSIKHVEDEQKTALKFIVHAGRVNVEVLGTQFNVNSYKEEETAVLLTKGKVRLSVDSKSEPLDMRAGELVEYSSKKKQLGKTTVAGNNYVAWMDHKYIFEKTTLEDVAKELQRYYGRSFIIQEPAMRKKVLSGTLELQDESVLIKTLSVLLGVTVYNDGNKVIIWSE